MKIELELTEAQVAQLFWSLSSAITLLREREHECEYHVQTETLQALSGLFLRGCEGIGEPGSGCNLVLLRKLLGGYGASL